MVTLGEGLGFVHKGTHDPCKFLRPAELQAGFEALGLTLQQQQGLGPTGWARGFTFGRHPTAWVMYQQVFSSG
jgi:2-polyprenyl-3-methyl-5-hydroxy-6-metoxy-1,4-benzoquinol methylase